jgi:hypothetical protein
VPTLRRSCPSHSDCLALSGFTQTTLTPWKVP